MAPQKITLHGKRGVYEIEPEPFHRGQSSVLYRGKQVKIIVPAGASSVTQQCEYPFSIILKVPHAEKEDVTEAIVRNENAVYVILGSHPRFVEYTEGHTFPEIDRFGIILREESGQTLEERLNVIDAVADPQRLMDINEALPLFIQILHGLQHMHRPGKDVVHYDVIPSNVLITPGTPKGIKLLDCGYSHKKGKPLRFLYNHRKVSGEVATAPGPKTVAGPAPASKKSEYRFTNDILFNSEYSPPEVIDPKVQALIDAEPQIDTYMAINLLRLMVCGAIVEKKDKGSASQKLPTVVKDLFDKGLAKDPRQRYQSVDEILNIPKLRKFAWQLGPKKVPYIHGDINTELFGEMRTLLVSPQDARTSASDIYLRYSNYADEKTRAEFKDYFTFRVNNLVAAVEALRTVLDEMTVTDTRLDKNLSSLKTMRHYMQYSVRVAAEIKDNSLTSLVKEAAAKIDDHSIKTYVALARESISVEDYQHASQFVTEARRLAPTDDTVLYLHDQVNEQIKQKRYKRITKILGTIAAVYALGFGVGYFALSGNSGDNNPNPRERNHPETKATEVDSTSQSSPDSGVDSVVDPVGVQVKPQASTDVPIPITTPILVTPRKDTTSDDALYETPYFVVHDGHYILKDRVRKTTLGLVFPASNIVPTLAIEKAQGDCYRTATRMIVDGTEDYYYDHFVDRGNKPMRVGVTGGEIIYAGNPPSTEAACDFYPLDPLKDDKYLRVQIPDGSFAVEPVSSGSSLVELFKDHDHLALQRLHGDQLETECYRTATKTIVDGTAVYMYDTFRTPEGYRIIVGQIGGQRIYPNMVPPDLKKCDFMHGLKRVTTEK